MSFKCLKHRYKKGFALHHYTPTGTPVGVTLSTLNTPVMLSQVLKCVHCGNSLTLTKG